MGTAALVSPLGKNGVVCLTDEDADDMWKDALTEVDLTGDPEAVLNSVLNGSSNELADKSNYINLSGLKDGPVDVPASATKPVSTGGLNGSSKDVADKSKDINMSGAEDGPEDFPAATSWLINRRISI